MTDHVTLWALDPWEKDKLEGILRTLGVCYTGSTPELRCPDKTSATEIAFHIQLDARQGTAGCTANCHLKASGSKNRELRDENTQVALILCLLLLRLTSVATLESKWKHGFNMFHKVFGSNQILNNLSSARKRKQTNPQTDSTALATRALNAGASAMGIALGVAHTCVFASGGGFKCWGWNRDGQLGIWNTTGDQTSPMDVALGSCVCSIARCKCAGWVGKILRSCANESLPLQSLINQIRIVTF
jgi:hypothetical protein